MLHFAVPREVGDFTGPAASPLERRVKRGSARARHVPYTQLAVRCARCQKVWAEGVELQALYLRARAERSAHMSCNSRQLPRGALRPCASAAWR